MKKNLKLLKLTGIIFLSTSALLSYTAKAVTDWSGEGVINFTEDTSIPPVTPPGTTEPEITEPPVNTDPAPLKILSVSNLDFDSHVLLTDDSNKVFPAKAFVAAIADENGDPTEELITMPNFIRFQDKRGNVDEHFYQISTKITKEFTNGNNRIVAASLDYSNAMLVSGTNNATIPSQNVLSTSFEVTLEDSVEVLNNQEPGKGFGMFEIIFGEIDNGTADSSVNLKVPGENILRVGDYVGEVTWYITDAR